MIGVFLIGFGQPQSLDDLKDFLKRVTGRDPTEKAVIAAQERYKAIGGSSPLLSITQKQAKALQELLEKSGISARVYIAMRHSPPHIEEAIENAKKDGVKHAVVITLAPQYSELSAGVYLRLFDDAHEAAGRPFTVKKVPSYGNHPLYLQAVAKKITEAFETYPPFDPKATYVIFSAHSLPAKILAEGDPYVGELEAGVKAITGNLKLRNTCLAFQSKGGGPVEWLGPSVEDVLENRGRLPIFGAKIGKRPLFSDVLISPLGFVSDHVETLYDLDILAKNKAEELGLRFRRAKSLNDSPEFIELLFELVKENLG